jgi:hypothetical protein
MAQTHEQGHTEETAESHGLARTGEKMVRGLLALALVACLAIVLRQTVASAMAERKTPQALRRAEQWDASNPETPVKLAHSMTTQTGGGDPKQIAAAFQQAVRLAPDRAENWAGLGDALDVAGDETGARTAYERAIELYPKSPAINWQFANFLVRQGDISNVAGPLRRSIEGDPSLRMGAFDLAWRAGMPAGAVLRIVPPTQQDRAAYLDYLTGSKRLDPAAEVWKLLLAAPAPFSLDSAFRYFDALLAAHRVDELEVMWAGLARHDPDKIHWQPQAAQRITNGGFDAPLLGGGFGWRMVSVAGADISLDPSIFHDAAPSLCIEFEGRHNLDFGNVVEYAAVEPDTKYDFTTFTRTDGITTDSGPRIAVYDPLDNAALWSQTPELTGTNSWQEEELQFRTGPRTRIVAVQVVRAPSQKFDNLIKGTMWLDDVSLKAIP